MQLPHGLQPTSLSFSLQDKRKTWLNMTCCSLLFLSRCSREKGPRKAGLGPLSGGLRRPPALSLRLQVTLEPRPCGCGNDRPRMREKAPSPRASVTAQGRGLLALAKGFRGHIASGHSGAKISRPQWYNEVPLFYTLSRIASTGQFSYLTNNDGRSAGLSSREGVGGFDRGPLCPWCGVCKLPS